MSSKPSDCGGRAANQWAAGAGRTSDLSPTRGVSFTASRAYRCEMNIVTNRPAAPEPSAAT
ncbi:hypothetical protein M3G91_34080, partial [Micromonospora chalcea]|uniref:hypothetical protein n=1 Tax=Micromonospora chalcea TaxID=1874 RepID=UPI0021A7FE85